MHRTLSRLLTIVIFFTSGILGGGGGTEASSASSRRAQTLFQNEETKCITEICYTAEADTNWNCISKCLSPACYAQIYGKEPLEEGELDELRRGKYVVCVNHEFRTKYRSSKDQANSWWDGWANVDESERTKRDAEWYGEALARTS